MQPTAGRSHDAVIRVCDDAGKVIETHEHAGDFKEWWPAETEEVSIRLHNPHRKSRPSS
jgi:hypothetical protein